MLGDNWCNNTKVFDATTQMYSQKQSEWKTRTNSLTDVLLKNGYPPQASRRENTIQGRNTIHSLIKVKGKKLYNRNFQRILKNEQNFKNLDENRT